MRDASLTLDALWVAACPDEARWFFDWMVGTTAANIHQHANLQIMFGNFPQAFSHIGLVNAAWAIAQAETA